MIKAQQVAQFLQASDELKNLCQPLLDNTPISNVGFFYLTKDNTVTPLSTLKEYLEAYLHEGHHQLFPSPSFTDIESGSFVTETIYKPYSDHEWICNLQDRFKMYNSFKTVQKSAEDANCFTVNFSEKSDHNLNFCINNVIKLTAFFSKIIPQVYNIMSALPKLTLRTVQADEAQANNAYLSAKARNFSAVSAAYDNIDELPCLTKRERDILTFCLQGRSAKQIGNCLSISHRTVQNTVDKIKIKFNVTTMPQLLALFISCHRMPSQALA